MGNYTSMCCGSSVTVYKTDGIYVCDRCGQPCKVKDDEAYKELMDDIRMGNQRGSGK